MRQESLSPVTALVWWPPRQAWGPGSGSEDPAAAGGPEAPLPTSLPFLSPPSFPSPFSLPPPSPLPLPLPEAELQGLQGQSSTTSSSDSKLEISSTQSYLNTKSNKCFPFPCPGSCLQAELHGEEIQNICPLTLSSLSRPGSLHSSDPNRQTLAASRAL